MLRRITLFASGALAACTAISGVGDLEANGVDGTPISSATDASSSSSSTSSTGGSSASSASSSSGNADASTSSSSASSSSSSSGQLDAGPDAPPTATVFSDNFDRTASGTVGNRWIEKTDHFSIQENQLVNVSPVDDGYYNIACFTPLVARDVQVDVDVVFPAADVKLLVDPTILVRGSDASVTTYNTYDGYTFWLVRDSAGFDREEPGPNKTSVVENAIAPTLETGVTYHVTFSVVGVDPPKLDAKVVDPRTNTTVVSLTYSDNDAAKRWTNAGHVSIGAATKGVNVRFDNFVQKSLD